MPRLITLLLLSLLVATTICTNHHHHHHRKPPRNHRHHSNDLAAIPDDSSSSSDIDERLALLHSERVAQATTCSEPRLQVVHVSDHYPGRYYLPHCTLLHRCGKHAGCCGTDRLRCVAEAKEKVVLNFYSVRILGNGQPAEKRIEKLAFTNHTKCGCVPVERVGKHDL